MITVADMITHLFTQLNTARGGTLEGKVRTAVLGGWSRLMAAHRWKYFHRSGSISLQASQTAGTVDYSTSTRLVTLTGATWPANVTAHQIKLGNDWFPIFRRISSTVIELWTGRGPVEDLDDSSYVLQQVMYPLPADVGDIMQVFEGQSNMPVLRLSLLETHVVHEGYNWSPQLPTTYALCGDTTTPNRWSLWIPTQLANAVNLQYFYVARRPMDVLVEETRGLASIANGVVTFSDSIVTPRWDGAVLRLGINDTDLPTGSFGALQQSDLVYNDAAYETRVVQIISANSVRVSDTTTSLTDVAYTASSHIDVSGGPMVVLLQRLIEDEYGARPVGGHTESLVSQRRLQAAIQDAMADDGRYHREKNALSQWYGLRLSDVAVIR